MSNLVNPLDISTTQKLHNAQKLYLEGIKQGQLEAVDTYTGERYTQHSSGVADGAEGFKTFFSDFLQRTSERDIRVIRAIEDGNYVFCHVYQDIDNGTAKWITTDMFDTNSDDKIIEHWDVIAPYIPASETKSGNDPILNDTIGEGVEIDGFQITDLDKTEANKATVRMFLTQVMQNKTIEAVDKYMATDFIEHNTKRDNGVEAFKQYLLDNDVMYDFVFHVMGQGDHVVSYSQLTENGQSQAIFDIYRLADGKIIEHWDNAEPMPNRPVEGEKPWANTGKF